MAGYEGHRIRNKGGKDEKREDSKKTWVEIGYRKDEGRGEKSRKTNVQLRS